MSQFDIEGKPRAWHTAFYYLAEHVRSLTNGALNHKGLYALVGTEGRYLNHANPTVRKRTAGALSRLVHSQAYAKDMRDSYLQSFSVFARAAVQICATVHQVRRWDDSQLGAYLRQVCWPDVREGLANERLEWRSEMDLGKVDVEMALLFDALKEGTGGSLDVRVATGADTGLLGGMRSGFDMSETLFATMLHVLAFGGLNVSFARGLADRYPTGMLVAKNGKSAVVEGAVGEGACLVRFADAAHSALLGTWTVTPDRPFTIGRYTDCDIVETDAGISRIHCYVYRKGGVWNFEDRHSHNGSRVMREGLVIYDSACDGSGIAVPLQQGDAITLAGRAHFWFGGHFEP